MISYYSAGLGFRPIESIAEDALSSASSSCFLESLVGWIFLSIRSLISSPVRVS